MILDNIQIKPKYLGLFTNTNNYIASNRIFLKKVVWLKSMLMANFYFRFNSVSTNFTWGSPVQAPTNIAGKP